MSSMGTSKGLLEVGKFGVYVTVPIFLMYYFSNNSKNLQKFMGNRSYVVYPDNQEMPPSQDEVMDMARKLSSKKKE